MTTTPRWRAVGVLAPFAAALAPAPGQDGLREVFPHVRADVAARIVEFDARVPIVLNDPDSDVFLEVIVCTPDTKEHESLLVTEAIPSNVHAAMLAVGLHPGAPGRYEQQDGMLVADEPTGDRVSVEFVWRDAAGAQRVEPAWSWVKREDDGSTIEPATWVFAGSRFVRFTPPGGQEREVYDADYAGTLVGLSTFGGETLAFPRVHSPEEAVEAPIFLADPARCPPMETPVIVRLRAVAQ